MDPDLDFGCSAGQTALWPWLAVQVTQVCLVLAEAQPLDTNMVLDETTILDSNWLLVAIWAIDNNTDPSCCWTMDPDMVLGSSQGLDVTVTLVGSSSHSDQH